MSPEEHRERARKYYWEHKEQCAEKNRKYRALNKNRLSTYMKARYRERYAASSVFITNAKDAPCLDCGNKYSPICMDFDHVRGVKFREVAKMQGYPIDKIKAEIEKCDLVCANCHRLRHANQRGARNREEDLDSQECLLSIAQI